MSINAMKYAELKPVFLEKYSPPETLVSGNPKQLLETYFVDPTNRFRSVIWEGLETGSYRLTYPANKHEFIHLLAGRVKVHSQDGTVIELVAGDSCVIPGRFDGIFEIVEPAKKHAVIVEGL